MSTKKKAPRETGQTVPPSLPTDASSSNPPANSTTPGIAPAPSVTPVTAPPNPPADSASENPPDTTQSNRTLRITAIEIENFKGIGRSLRIDLRPITLLFGRNSAGKSTVLHALCYTNDILNHKNIDAHTTVAGGDNVRLGGFNHLVHSHDPTRQVRFRFDLSLDNWDVPAPLPSQLLDELHPTLPEPYTTEFFQEPVTSAWVEIVVSAPQGKPAVTSYEVGINDLYLGRLYLDDSTNVMLEVNGKHPLLYRPGVLDFKCLDQEVLDTIRSLADKLTSLEKAAGQHAEAEKERNREARSSGVDLVPMSDNPFSTQIPDCRRQLLQTLRQAYANHIRAFAGTVGLIGQRATTDSEANGHTWPCTTIRTYNLGSALPPWNELLYLAVDDLDDYQDLLAGPDWMLDMIDHDDIFRAVMSFLLVGIGSTLANELSHFRYIGPVRDLHPDTGIGSRTGHARLWADGSAAWSLLCDRTPPGSSSFLNDVNDWLARGDRLDTGYRLEDHSYVELSSSAPLVETSRLLRRLGISFADGFSPDDLDPWIREQFRPFEHHIPEPELLAAIIAAIKADESIDPKATQLRQAIQSSALRQATSSDDGPARPASNRLALLATETILHIAAATQREYRNALVLRDVLAGEVRPQLLQLLSHAATAQLCARLHLATSDGLALSTSDIGVGISQVLPVVVASLDPNRPALTAIEQPELHVHPRLQVELGDLFGARVDTQGAIILETHSEHLLLRIMRRIRQTNSGQLPDGAPAIRSTDVSVVFVEHDGRQSLAHQMPLTDDGELVKAWPGGFFEEDLHEVV